MPIHPSINRILSRRRRTLAAGLSVLLAPALVVACGGPKHADSAPAGDAASRVTSPTAAARVTPAPSETSDSPSPSTTRTPSASATTATPVSPSTTAVTPTTPPASSASPSVPGSPSVPAGTPGKPQAPLPGTVLHSTASGGRTVALTFDDGPGPATGPILDLLRQYGVHATFCEIGNNAAADPAMVKRILAEGHQLCDHTMDHPQPMHTQPHDKQVWEIGNAETLITKAGGAGAKTTWWRAPGGDFTSENVAIASDLGMKSLGWTVDPRDWSRPGVPAIVSNVEQNLRPGGVVLMHDGGGDRSQTVAALKQLLPWLVAQGYHFDFPAS